MVHENTPMLERRPLHLGNSIEALEVLVQNDFDIKNYKKVIL